MCAIFGFISTSCKPPGLETLFDIVSANISRGAHAFGFAWVDSMGRMRCYKQAGSLARHRPFLNLLADARLIIGHLRYATHGAPEDNITNHPHPCDGGWVVHNGVISNYDAVIRRNDIWPVSDCDSEVLGLMAENSAEKTPVNRLADAVLQTTGNLACMGIWKSPRQIVTVKRGNPLHLSQGREGIYMGSYAEGLPGADVRSHPNDSAISFVMNKGKTPTVTTYKLRQSIGAVGGVK